MEREQILALVIAVNLGAALWNVVSGTLFFRSWLSKRGKPLPATDERTRESPAQFETVGTTTTEGVMQFDATPWSCRARRVERARPKAAY